MAATITPSEDTVFDAIWGWVASLFDASVHPNIFKGFQNITSTPLGSYIVLSPGIAVRQDQIRRTYDSVNDLSLNQRNTTYSYQVDCYGSQGPDFANIVAIAWRTMAACDYFDGSFNDPPTAPLPATPLYADEPNQLNIANGENVYEQRFMLRLFLQVNQVVSLSQDFFTGPTPVEIKTPADLLPP